MNLNTSYSECLKDILKTLNPYQNRYQDTIIAKQTLLTPQLVKKQIYILTLISLSLSRKLILS